MPLPRGLRERAAFLAALRRMPENREIPFTQVMRPLVSRSVEHIPGISAIDRKVRKRTMTRDLQLLNDVLARSPLAGRYWLWAGLVLGWAREGRILPHDQRDADFAYEIDDHDRMEATRPLLAEAGFKPWFRFRNNAGEVAEQMFVRHGARFEFFRLKPMETTWEYNMFTSEHGVPIEYHSYVPRQPLESFDFLDRSWLKVADHDQELTFIYGNWRVPDPSWNSVDQGGTIDKYQWTGGPD